MLNQEFQNDAVAPVFENYPADARAKWQPPFLRYASVMTRDQELALDTLQEAWVKIICGLAKLKDPLKFVGWSYRVINNQCLDNMRKQKRAKAYIDEETLHERAEAPFKQWGEKQRVD